MRATPDGDLLAPAQAAADPADPVGDHRLAIARTAEDDAPFELAAGHRFSYGTNEIGVVDRGLGRGAEVTNDVPVGGQHGLDGFFVGKTCVIGAEREFHSEDIL